MTKYVLKRILFAAIAVVGIITIVFVIGLLRKGDPADCVLAKPVIYLYPETETDVSVKLSGVKLNTTWPESAGEWRLTAQPGGTLINKADGLEYSYIFWEGEGDISFDFSEGFCVKGEETGTFLRETLAAMGLTPREYNEFIVYWLPLMQENEYNLISFQGENYTDAAKLEILPEPESVLRVFMAWKAADGEMEIAPQEITCFERKGFTVVEWGGCEIK